jgi:hypothetical protein
MRPKAKLKIDLPAVSSSDLGLDRLQSQPSESVMGDRRFGPNDFARGGRFFVRLGPNARELLSSLRHTLKDGRQNLS